MEEIQHVVQPSEEGWRLGRVIRSSMQVSASQLKSARWNGRLFLDGAPARADDRVHAGQTVSLCLAQEPPRYHPTPWATALNIPYADASLLVVDKPAPMACQSSARQPDNTLENALCAWEGNPPDYVYRPVNRLDKGTSGLMVVARSAHVQQLLQRQLHSPQMIREYLAITQGEPPAEEGLIDLPIAKAEGATVRRCVSPTGKPAVTHYRVLRHGGGRALVLLRLETGRTHQIRVHLAALGCPVAGDFLYGEELPALPGRFALHSHRLLLHHPLTGEEMALCSPLPPALAALMPE